MAVDDALFFERMLILSQCLCQAIEDAGLPKPCFCGVVPGDAAIADYVSCETDTGCGMAWVRLVSITPSETEVLQFTPCMPPLVALMEVGVLRCAFGLNDDGTPPDEQKQLLTVRQTLADMAASLKAITCGCTGFGRGDVQIINWVPLSESGGGVGGAWNFSLAQSYG